MYSTHRNRNNARHLGHAIKVINIKIINAFEAKGSYKFRHKSLLKLRHRLLKESKVELLNDVNVRGVELPKHERGPAATIEGWDKEGIPKDFPIGLDD